MKKAWHMSNYCHQNSPWPVSKLTFGPSEERKIITRKHNSHGEYFEVRELQMNSIDATCLRAGEVFYTPGVKILYASNSLFLGMRPHNSHQNPSTCVSPTRIHRPLPTKPTNPRRRNKAIERAISHMETRTHFQNLQGWVYFDPFLRFINTIGPRNAATIKTLTLSGVVKLHDCPGSECQGECTDDMVSSLALYIPFIVKFLNGLETLTLRVTPDSAYLDRFDDPEDPLTPYETLAYVLENKLRTIPSLTKLEVLEMGNSPSRYEQGIIDVAKPTITWFEKRSEKRTRAAFQWNHT